MYSRSKCSSAGLKCESIYEVQSILKKRTRNGKLEYFVKWKNFGNDSNTWEPKEHLTNCKESIIKFEKKLKRKQKKQPKPIESILKKKKTSEESDTKNSTASEENEHNEDFEPERIIGTFMTKNGELMHYLKAKGVEKATVISAKKIKQLYPLIYINYYQEHIVWESSGNASSTQVLPAPPTPETM